MLTEGYGRKVTVSRFYSMILPHVLSLPRFSCALKSAAYAAWPRQSQREYCGPHAGTDTTLPAQLCQYCRGAVAADRTNQPENCSEMRKTLHVICADCWALFHFGLQILRLETFRFCRLGFYGVFFSCIEIRWYRASFSFFPRNHISPHFPQFRKAGS